MVILFAILNIRGIKERMIDFKDIEKEYLSLEPLDNETISAFYYKHQSFFDNDPPKENDSLLKTLWMLSEIGTTFSFAEQHNIALPILDRTVSLYRKNALKLKLDLEKEDNYNSAIWNKGYSLFQLGKYLKAKPYLKNYTKIESSENKMDEDLFLKVCENKIKNKILLIVGILGVIILVFSYFIQYILPEYDHPIFSYFGILGGILLMIYGVFYSKIDLNKLKT